MTEASIEKTVAELTAEDYIREKILKPSVDRLVADLRYLADTIEREGSQLDRVGKPGVPTYVGVMSGIQDKVLSDLVNMKMANLARSAVDADVDRGCRNPPA